MNGDWSFNPGSALAQATNQVDDNRSQRDDPQHEEDRGGDVG